MTDFTPRHVFSPLDIASVPVKWDASVTSDRCLLRLSKLLLWRQGERYRDSVNAARASLSIQISCGPASGRRTDWASEAGDLRKDE